MTISAEDVKKLREKTSAGIMDCKTALTETKGDIDKAIEYLRKKGITAAEKKLGRETKEGLIQSYIHPNKRLGVLLEVNCETDFVARTADFSNFVRQISEHIARTDHKVVHVEELLKQNYVNDPKITIEYLVKQIIGKLGENVILKRFDRFELEKDHTIGLIQSYIHPGNRLGVLLEVNCEDDSIAQQSEFSEFVKNIAMQIAATNPRVISRDQISKEIIENELNIYKTQAKSQNKPDHIAEKMALGKLDKFYQEVCLLEQSYIKDPNITIDGLLKSLIKKLGGTIVIRQFLRFELGG